MDKKQLRDELMQYYELREEIKDLRIRIDHDERRLRKIEEEGVVSDTVTGTRRDGTIGAIRITGYPVPEYESVCVMIRKRIAKLHICEEELLEALNRVDDYINQIPKSDLRMMFRFYYLDDMSWSQVAMTMNRHFPKRKIKYTEDNCRIRCSRYLENEEK